MYDVSHVCVYKKKCLKKRNAHSTLSTDTRAWIGYRRNSGSSGRPLRSAFVGQTAGGAQHVPNTTVTVPATFARARAHRRRT